MLSRLFPGAIGQAKAENRNTISNNANLLIRITLFSLLSTIFQSSMDAKATVHRQLLVFPCSGRTWTAGKSNRIPPSRTFRKDVNLAGGFLYSRLRSRRIVDRMEAGRKIVGKINHSDPCPSWRTLMPKEKRPQLAGIPRSAPTRAAMKLARQFFRQTTSLTPMAVANG